MNIQKFLSMPSDALMKNIIICNYGEKTGIAVSFYDKKRQPFMYRIRTVDEFSSEQLIEILKEAYWKGELRFQENWCETIGKLIKRMNEK